MWTLEVDWDPVIKNYKEIMSLLKDRCGTGTELTYSFGADKTSVVVLNQLRKVQQQFIQENNRVPIKNAFQNAGLSINNKQLSK